MTEHKYNTLLSFSLGDETFALDAMKVNHILEIPDITKVPDTPEFMKGIINLHGNIIPVVDMRMMMGLEVTEFTVDSAIVVIAPDNQQGSNLGLMVDMVKEVIEVEGLEVQPTVINNEESLIRNFHGTFSYENSFVHIIDMDELAMAAEIVKEV